MRFCVGTSGYSYKEWKGPFYPEKLPAKDMLSFYSERLPAVEINNTFYRLPKRSVLEAWAAQVPDGFRFSIKASRRITHLKRLKDAGDETGILLEASRALGDRLGVLIFQLPPNLKLDLERFDRFLDLLPADVRAAFEFRHDSWREAAVHERLKDRGCGLVVVDSEDEADPDALPTGPFSYFRLRRPGYARADLAAWAARMREAGGDEAFVFFKHEDEGAGPRLAAEFLEVAERASRRKRPRTVGESGGRARKAG